MNLDPFSAIDFDFDADLKVLDSQADGRKALKDYHKADEKEQKQKLKLIKQRLAEKISARKKVRKPPVPKPKVPRPPRPPKPKPELPEYVMITNVYGRRVRIKRKNQRLIKQRNTFRRRQILKTLHNADMSTEPKESLEAPYDLEYASSEENLPRHVNEGMKKTEYKDVEPMWRTQDPRKRKSWTEFCQDFLGQNYGAIAQSMLEIYQTDKAQFMRFALEMGKQSSPASMQINMDANVKSQNDIYAQLKAMSASPVLPSGEKPQIEAAPEFDALPAPEEPIEEPIPAPDDVEALFRNAPEPIQIPLNDQ